MSRSTNPLSFLARSAAASKWFPTPSVILTLHPAPAALLVLAPTPPGTVTHITRSAAIQHARGIHSAPRLVYPVVRHIRSAPKAFNIVHPRFRASKAYAWYSATPWILQPDRHSQNHSACLGCPMRPLVSYQSLSAFADCWQQTCSARVDVSVLPACQHPSLTHARTPVPLWQLFDWIFAVSSVSF